VRTGLVSRPSAASALARAEREPGSSARIAKRDPLVSPWVPGLAEFILGPRTARTRGLARDTGVRSRGAQSEPLAVAHLTMSNSAVLFAPAARCCARVLAFPFASIPKEGWAERRQAHYLCCRVSETRLIRTQRDAARPMTRDARLSALHRGDFRPGAALPSPALPPDPCSELLAARSSCLAGGVPDLPSPRLRAAAAGRHSPLRLQDRL
jgi:hypothetical protein